MPPRHWKVQSEPFVADYSAGFDDLNPKHWPAYTYPATATAIAEKNRFWKVTPMQHV